MSLRYLYRKISSKRRLCNWCGNPILRNIDEHDSALYHHGCLMTAKDTYFKCLECLNRFDGTHVNQTDFGDGLGPQLTCGNCGSTHLQRIKPSRTSKM